LREEITGSYTQGGAFSPALGSRIFSYADDDTAGERNIYDLPDYSEPTSSPAPQVRNICRKYSNNNSDKIKNVCTNVFFIALDIGGWSSNDIFDTR